MNYLTGICSDRAAHLIAENRLFEAFGLLIAARLYGGGPGVEQNAAYLAWRLSDDARTALLEGRMEAAAASASFALILAESPQALFILASATLEDHPSLAFGLAARMETASPREAADLRAAAVKVMAAAWSRMAAGAEVQGAALAQRLAQCVADHPDNAEAEELSAALAGRLPPASEDSSADNLALDHRAWRHLSVFADLEAPHQHLEALSHFAAALTLSDDAPWLARHRGRLNDRLLGLYFDAAAQGEMATLEALALLCAYAPQVTALNQLMDLLVAREEWEAASAIARQQLGLAGSTTVEWNHAAQFDDLSRRRMNGEEAASAKAGARSGAIERLTATLDRHPQRHELRNMRAELRFESRQFSLSLEDYRAIAAHVEQGAPLAPRVAEAVAFNLLFLLPGGRRPETVWAAGELTRDPPTDMASLRSRLLRLWEAGATDEGRKIAALIAESAPEYRLYADLSVLVEDLDRAPAAQFGRKPAGRRLVYGSLICWGSSYLEMLESTALASLASPGNLPALARSADIVLELLVGPRDVAQVTAMPILRVLSAFCEVRVIALPFPDGDAGLANRLPYVVYGHGSHFTLLRARRDGADLLNLHPDLVYADGAIGALAPLTQGPPRVFFADGLNVAKTPLLAALEARRRDGRLTVDARTLATLSAPHWMPRLTDCLYDPGAEEVIHYPHRLVFLEADRVVMHSFCKTPLYVANEVLRDIQTFNYATVDGYLLDAILDHIRRDQIFEVTDADPILFVELSDDEGVRYSKVAAPLQQVVANMFYIFPFSARRYWLFENGVNYPPGERGVLVEPQQRLRFLADLRDAVTASPQFVELDRERNKTRPEAVRG